MANTPSSPQNPHNSSEPQHTAIGYLKSNQRTDMVVFTFSFLIAEVTCIVPIPAEGTTTVPVYMKFKLKP